MTKQDHPIGTSSGGSKQRTVPAFGFRSPAAGQRVWDGLLVSWLSARLSQSEASDRQHNFLVSLVFRVSRSRPAIGGYALSLHSGPLKSPQPCPPDASSHRGWPFVHWGPLVGIPGFHIHVLVYILLMPLYFYELELAFVCLCLLLYCPFLVLLPPYPPYPII